MSQPKTVKREDLLAQLESVMPGLSKREIIEQSSCFVFQDGVVMTYNDEIACTQKCDLGITGAVRSEAFLAILRKLVEEEIEISEGEGVILLRGKRKDVQIVREADVQLPIASVERPTKWTNLHEDFLDAIEMVQHCATTDESQFVLTCVHIAPEHIEACDNAQMTRVYLPTGVKEPILVRRDSVKHITALGMTQVSETTTWIHFRNPKGLVLSCRRFTESYHDLSGLLEFKGAAIVLPKGLKAAADKASVFAMEEANDAQVTVELRPDKLRIRGTGPSGSYKQVMNLTYQGEPLAFQMNPALLQDIVARYNTAEINPQRIRVREGKKWVFIACLRKLPEKEEG